MSSAVPFTQAFAQAATELSAEPSERLLSRAGLSADAADAAASLALPESLNPDEAASAAGAQRGNLFAEACPSREVLKHVTSRWGVMVLVALLQGGTLRFAELRRRIGGVSEKMLAQTLQWLEADGFVHRQAHPVVPPHVDYRLSPLGAEVAQHVQDLAEWIEGRFPAIQAAQAQVAARRQAD